MAKRKHSATRDATPPAKVGTFSTDSFQNFCAKLGINTDNLTSGSTYGFNFLTVNRLLLEAMYRGSWIIGAAVDIPADDMTHGGITIRSENSPGDVADLQEGLEDLQIWPALNNVIKWSRLYGSALGFIMIDGQKPSTPLRLDTVSEGQFKGILPLDRWQVEPPVSGTIITEYGPNIGQPNFYTMIESPYLPNLGKIHHSRVIRLDAIELPYYQKITNNLWGESVIERLNDRLIAFDSTTTGVAQLVYRAYLRTWSIEKLREIISAGGDPMKALEANIAKVRQLQSSEGITLIDKNDTFETHQYTFAGLDAVLLQFGQQLAGALEIPLVRLFGQSPAGLNSTGESDLQIYYNGIKKKQNNVLRRPVKTLLELVSRSMLKKELPDGFTFEFNPLWNETNKEKAEIAQANTTAITTAFDTGVVTRETALKELKQMSDRSGVFTNITDEDIRDAENDPPLSEIAAQEHEGREKALNEPDAGQAA
jgi:phage-related protein (TIGR01555 family)